MRCATAKVARFSSAKPPAYPSNGPLTRAASSQRTPNPAKPTLAMALPAGSHPDLGGTEALKAVLADKTRRTTAIDGLRALREGPNPKSVFLLDQYGVLHDGKQAYPCAIETVRNLHESGARLFIISNSSRRASGTLRKLEKLRFDPNWFEGVVTSGEITYEKLSSRNDLTESDVEGEGDRDPVNEAFSELGDRCLHFTWSARGAVRLDGIEGLVTVAREAFLERVNAGSNDSEPPLRGVRDAPPPRGVSDAPPVENASERNETDGESGGVDFLLAHGTECVNGGGETDEERALTSSDVPIEDMKTILEAAAQEGLPLVVANPDLVTVSGKEGLLPMPGTLASWYSEMPGAGPIYLMGKPSLVVQLQKNIMQ